MLSKRILSVVVLSIAVVVLLFWFIQPEPIAPNQVRVTLGGKTVVADVVDTEPLREKGLSGRTALSDEEGMLFVFPSDGTYAFWMKDMLIPIDMIWLASDKRAVYIAANASPQSYPNSFVPDTQARYVLEVPAGWTERYRISVGSEASW